MQAFSAIVLNSLALCALISSLSFFFLDEKEAKNQGLTACG
jgi:hypothetical protein